MCGIAGIFRRDGAAVDDAEVARMLRVLVHRGPDDEGIYLAEGIGLGHRRLSIIDVSAAGHQPMPNAAGTTWITYNGELYNHRELRLELERSGCRFRSQSDTEVILQSYERLGTDCIHQFNGMFAFAIWDAQRRSLFCARDRIGIKPFYYVDDGRQFVFASEVKALLAVAAVSAEPDVGSLLDYLTFAYVRGERTLFRRVRKLLPGEMLVVCERGSARSLYWDAAFDESDKRPEPEIVEELTTLMDDAVRRQLQADVPVGTHLSGGLDSSLVTGLAMRHHPGRLFSFNGRFAEGPDYDESRYARAVARHVNAELMDVLVDDKNFVPHMAHLVWHMDEPTAGPGLYPQYMVCRAARTHVKVALGGQGGDEIFVGYPHHRDDLCMGLVVSALRGRRNAGSGYAVSDALINVVRRGQERSVLSLLFRGLEPLPSPRAIRHLLQRSAASWGLVLDDAEMLSSPFASGLDGGRTPEKSKSLLNGLLYHDLKHYLPSLLHVEDRTSMAVSLESRVPLLDHRIVEFMARVPSLVKFPAFRFKHLLRQVATPILPELITHRVDKKGFPTPLMLWLRRLRSDRTLTDLLSARSLQRTGLFRRNPLLGHEGDMWRTWTVLNLELWCRVFLEGSWAATEACVHPSAP